MSTISSSTTRQDSTIHSSRSATSPATTNRTNTTPSTDSKPTSTQDRVSFSNESGRSSGSEGASLSLLDGLKANYAAENVSKVSETAPTDASAAEAKPKTADEKLDNLKATIDSLKGLQGEQLQAKLEEIKKTDPELAEYLKKMLEKDDKTEDKKEVAEAKPAEKANSGGDDGAPSETFLWKPVSESDGKLVILLPTSLSATSVSVSGPNYNETVEKGGRNGSRGNGQREHFRFGKSGEDMQGPVQVTVALENGGTKTISIPKPAERNEGGKLSDGQ